MIFRFALKELFRHRLFNLALVLNLSLGIMGYLSIESFKESIETFMAQNARQILSADLAVSARRPLTDAELEQMNSVIAGNAEKTTLYDFFAMASSTSTSKLVMIKAIGDEYPFFGQLKLESGPVFDSKSSPRFPTEKPVLWAYPEVKYLFNVKAGDKLKLGAIEFEVQDFILKDESQTFRLASLAPRVYISSNWLKKTDLIQFGSTYTLAHLFRFHDPLKVASTAKLLEKSLKDPAIQVDTADSASESSLRQLKYLTDYLGLSSLIVLLLASVGGLYLFRIYLNRKMKDMAVERVLGLTPSQVQALYTFQILLLSFISLLPALLGTWLFLPALVGLIQQIAPVSLNASLSWLAVGKALLISTVIHFLMVFPYLYEIQKMKPHQLFQEQKLSQSLNLKNPFLYLPLMIAVYGLCIWSSHSFKVGGIFFGALIAVMAFFFGLGWLLLKGFQYLPQRGTWTYMISLKSLYRRKEQSLILFAVLGLSSLLINILPQLKSNLKNEFQVDRKSSLPSCFLFDIQDEQLQKLQTDLQNKKINLQSITPMVRARLLQVNGENYEKKTETGQFQTREEEQEARFRNRGLNLTFREKLSSSEEVVQGEPITTKYNPDSGQKALVSVEKGYADRMKLKIGDDLVFDIQGLEIEAKIANLRRIQWNSFQPNFFISFQDGVINEAPKTYIATLQGLSETEKSEIQFFLAKNYPNISSLDVHRTVDQILETSEKMSWSLELMSGLALLTGFLILYSIIQNQVRTRQWELNLLKILGSDESSIQKTLFYEFLLIAAMAVLMGLICSFIFSAFLLTSLFDIPFKPDFGTPAISFVFILALGALLIWLSSRRIVNEKPLALLRSAD